MSRGRGRSRREGHDLADVVLNTAIIASASVVAILLLSTLVRAAWPGSAGVESRKPVRLGEVAKASGAASGAARTRDHRNGGQGSVGAAVERAAESRSRSGESRQVIRVQVLNGCGVDGAGSKLASLLRRSTDIDVVEIGNADRVDYETTIVLDRTGRAAAARRVASFLGDPPVVLQRDLDERFDVIVIVGHDQARWLGSATRTSGGG